MHRACWQTSAIALAALMACDQSRPGAYDATRDRELVPLRLVRASVTTGYAPKLVGGPPLVPVRTELSEGALVEGVSLSPSIVLELDRWLLPSSSIRQSLCLRPVLDTVVRFEDCVDPTQPFSEPAYDPATRAVVLRLREGERLLESTTYRLTVLSPGTSGGPGYRAFDEAPLLQRYVFDFRTQSAAEAAAPERTQPEPLPSETTFCAAVACAQACSTRPEPERSDCLGACRCVDDEIDPDAACDARLHLDPPALFNGCSGSTCHGGSVTAAMGLQLGTAKGLRDTALGITAHQTQNSAIADVPELSPTRLGHAMPRITPRDPSSSYVIYKLLAKTANHGAAFDEALESDVLRLREQVVVGLPMPPYPGVGVSREDMRRISAWIAHGAVLQCP